MKIVQGIKRWGRPLVSLALMAYIFAMLDIRNGWTIIEKSTLSFLLLGFASYLAAVLVDATRFFLFFNKFSSSIKYTQNLYIHFLSLFYGVFLPAGSLSSEMIRGYQISKYGYSKSEIFTVIMIIRGIGFYALLAAAAIAGLMVNMPDPAVMMLTRIIAGVFFVATITGAFFFLNKNSIRLGQNINRRLNISTLNFSQRISNLLNVQQDVIVHRKLFMLSLFLLTCLDYIFFIIGNIFFSKALGMDLSFINMAWITGITGISQILPLATSIFGMKDITFWYLLKLKGYNFNQIGSFLIVINLSLLLITLSGGFWEFVRSLGSKDRQNIT